MEVHKGNIFGILNGDKQFLIKSDSDNSLPVEFRLSKIACASSVCLSKVILTIKSLPIAS